MADRFTESQMFKLVETYRDYECLWNPFHDSYKNRDAREFAYQEIADKLNIPGLLGRNIPKKIKNMRSSYYQELKRIEKSIRSGASKAAIYKPKVSWFTMADGFLRVYRNHQETFSHNPESTKELEDNSTSESSIDLLTNCSPSRHSDLASKPNVDTVPSLKRKPLNGPELMQPRAQTVEAFKLVKQSDQLRDDDECSTFGILIAQKLRKLTDTRRDYIMARINQVFYEENMERERQFSSQPSISSSIPRRAESSYMTMPTEVVSNDNSDYEQGFVLKEESCSSSDM